MKTYRELKATRFGFGEGVAQAAEIDQNVVGIGADITQSVCMNIFSEKFPGRFFSMGIAEQNCIGAAAGLALTGKIPVFSTYAAFAVMRTLDQIRVSVCYNNLHVIIGGAHAGISVGPDGATHQALEDIAALRAIPNIVILSPCDATQTKIASMHAILKQKSPVYIRFGREAVPDFSDPKQTFEIGKAQVLKEGTDVSIIATGHLVYEALIAAEVLAKQGISSRVLNMHTIKPIDAEEIIRSAKITGAIVSAEEHQVYGGLGSAVAEVLATNYPVPMEMLGMYDCFGESGKPEELMNKYGLTAENIVKLAIKAISRKG